MYRGRNRFFLKVGLTLSPGANSLNYRRTPIKASRRVQRSSKKSNLPQSCNKNGHPVPTEAVLKKIQTNCIFDLPSIRYILRFLKSVASKKNSGRQKLRSLRLNKILKIFIGRL